MGTSSSIKEALAKIERAIDNGTKAMVREGGEAAVKAARKAAAGDLGGDRRMSGLRRGSSLDATSVVHGDRADVLFTPAGAWMLAERGRRGSGKVVTAEGHGHRVFLTPKGPRPRFRVSASRGLRTLTDAQQQAGKEVPPAAMKGLHAELGKVF